jgi:hypothetical protein
MSIPDRVPPVRRDQAGRRDMTPVHSVRDMGAALRLGLASTATSHGPMTSSCWRQSGVFVVVPAWAR